jgi:RNA polymerase sigma-70 factor (ECF subfamily)
MAGPGRPGERSPRDEELVARVLSGDQESYAALVSRYSDFVYTIVLRVVGDAEDADDVTQETFVRAYRALGRFRGDSKFSSWLYRIAVNRAITHLKRKRRRALTVDLDAVPHVEASAVLERREANPEDIVLDEEFRQRVRKAVAELPPQYRAVVTLFYLEERSYKEVAEILGIPMGTLKTHLHRARGMLRKTLSERGLRRGRNT